MDDVAHFDLSPVAHGCLTNECLSSITRRMEGFARLLSCCSWCAPIFEDHPIRGFGLLPAGFGLLPWVNLYIRRIWRWRCCGFWPCTLDEAGGA